MKKLNHRIPTRMLLVAGSALLASCNSGGNSTGGQGTVKG
jgi:predicted small secreted protein